MGKSSRLQGDCAAASIPGPVVESPAACCTDSIISHLKFAKMYAQQKSDSIGSPLVAFWGRSPAHGRNHPSLGWLRPSPKMCKKNKTQRMHPVVKVFLILIGMGLCTVLILYITTVILAWKVTNSLNDLAHNLPPSTDPNKMDLQNQLPPLR